MEGLASVCEGSVPEAATHGVPDLRALHRLIRVLKARLAAIRLPSRMLDFCFCWSTIGQSQRPPSCGCSAARPLRACYKIGRVIPSFCILFCRVVRLSPRRSAAPPLPAILPDAALSASKITLRSASWNVEIEVVSGE